MHTIWKYQLEIKDEQEILMPKGSLVLSAGLQNNIVCIWVLVDSSTGEHEPITIKIFGTGNPLPIMPPTFRFIGTIIQTPFVWHIFAQDNKGLQEVIRGFLL